MRTTSFVDKGSPVEGKSVRSNVVPVFLCVTPSVPRLLPSLLTGTWWSFPAVHNMNSAEWQERVGYQPWHGHK